MLPSAENESRERLRAARRVVVKLGTSVVSGAGGEVSAERVGPLVRSMAELHGEGRQVVLVSSGAVGLGAGRLGLARARLADLVTRQACAAVGQSLLMHAYERLFGAHGIKIAQVLLTEADFADRARYSNLRGAVEKLLKLGVLPVVNENDTVSTAELEYLPGGAERIFSDNDRLAALVASKLQADALVLLTDVEGLLERVPRGHDAAAAESRVVPVVREVTPDLRRLAAGPSAGGRGGMLSKIDAAQIALNAGGVAVIASGRRPDTLARVFAGEPVGTFFVSASRMRGRRRWIAYAGVVRGRLVVNEGAREAILRGKASLLSSGVVGVEREFGPLEVVSIVGPDGREFARGLSNYASAEAAALIGRGDRAPAGRPGRASVLVTRDNIVILEGRGEDEEGRGRNVGAEN